VKLTEVDARIQEDIGKWLGNTVAKTGLLGSTRKLDAEQQATQKRVYDIGFKYFKNELDQIIQRGVKSGFIVTEPPTQSSTTSTSTTATSSGQTQADNTDLTVKVEPGYRLVIPKSGSPNYYKIGNKWYNAQNQPVTNAQSIQSLESMADGGNAREERLQQNSTPTNKKKTQKESKFQLVNVILEERELMEQSSVGGVIQNFIDTQTSNFADIQEYDQYLSKLSKQAEQEYLKNGKISDKTYQDMWSTIFNWSKMGSSQKSGQQSRTSSVARDTEITDLNKNGIADTEERIKWHDQLVQDLNSIDPNNKADMKKLADIAIKIKNFVKPGQ
jgi:hypothetical protein